MSDSLESTFVDFANKQEDLLKELNLSKEEFIEKARVWSETKEGKLEIQKFILQQEINTLQDEIDERNSLINKKKDSINDIEEELRNL